MNIINIFKLVTEEIFTYFSSEVFNDKDIKELKLDQKGLSNIKTTQDFEKFVTDFISDVEAKRHSNQSQLQEVNCQVQLFAHKEMILSSLLVAFENLLEAYKNIVFLSDGDTNVVSNSINEKFAIRKICALSITLLAKYEQLPKRLRKNDLLDQIIALVKTIVTKTSITEVEKLTKEILGLHCELLKSEQGLKFAYTDEEYSWIHDILKLARLNAEAFGILVYTEIYVNIIKNNYYNQEIVNK